MYERYDAFGCDLDVNICEASLDKAVDDVQSMFLAHYKDKLQVSSITESLDRLPSDTSAGFPFVSGTKKNDARKHLRAFAAKQWRDLSVKNKFEVVPCLSGVRNTIRPIGENKPRLIFAFPGYINVLETQFLDPFMCDPPPFTGWYFNWLDDGLSYDRYKNLRHGANSWANVDLKGFDASVLSRLIRLAFSILRNCMELTDIEDLMLENLVEYFIHTPLAMYGELRQKHRGIPSGSSFTGLIGTIVNMLSGFYASHRSDRYSIIPSKCVWLGDDSSLFFDEGMVFEDFEIHYLSYFAELGQTVNTVKTVYKICGLIPSQVSFLGKTFLTTNRAYGIDYDKLDAQAMLPEKSDKDKFDVASRLIGLAWSYGMDWSAYDRLQTAYDSLHIGEQSVMPRREVLAFVRRVLGVDVDLTSFPSFDSIQFRYFGTLLQPVPYYTKWIRFKQWE